MTTLTYCKGLPTPIDELTLLGLTDFELFLFDYSVIVHRATLETVNHLLSLEKKLEQSKWNTHLQKAYGISKRHAGGIIAHAQGKVASAKECRIDQIKQLESRLKSALMWVNKAKKKVKLAQKFYAKKDWQHGKTGCIFPLSTSLETQKTNWHQLKFTLHHKQRYIHKLEQQIKCLKIAQVRVKVSRNEVFIVGSKDESYGNQVCQWDGNMIKFRVPYSLEFKFGWAYIDFEGNLQVSGRVPLQIGLSTGAQDAQIVDACCQLAVLAASFACPIVCENLDFTAKKSQLRERGRKYARMLSSWAYSRFYHLLESILSNRGISLFKRNPAYTSLIGLVKYARMYGLSSDIAAAIAIARRGMNLSERLPRSMSAYLGVNPRKHVWNALHQLNKFIGRCVMVNRRHDYYSVSNWGSLVKLGVE